MSKTKQRRLVIFATILCTIAAIILGVIIYSHVTLPVINAKYIATNYSNIKIPSELLLVSKTESDAVPNDVSLPAQGNYSYKLLGNIKPRQGLELLHKEIKKEGFTTSEIKKYTVNGSYVYVFTAKNNKIWLDCRILEDTPKSTVYAPDDGKLDVFVVKS